MKLLNPVFRLVSLIMGGILGLFFGCRCDSPIRVAYGMPHADFKFSGIVLSFDQQSPVKGLRVGIKHLSADSSMHDSTLTDSLGKYSLTFTDLPLEKWILTVKDIDSSLNGSFSDKDTAIQTPQNEMHGGDGKWYKGRIEKNINLNLDRKTN
jgi:putative lipoprotein (rSAM/lipoprotein system)